MPLEFVVTMIIEAYEDSNRRNKGDRINFFLLQQKKGV